MGLVPVLGPIWNALSRLLSIILQRAAVTAEFDSNYQGLGSLDPTAWRDGENFAVWVPFRFRVLNNSQGKQVRISRVRCGMARRWRYSAPPSMSEHSRANLGDPISGGDFSDWIDCIWAGWGQHKKQAIPKRAKITIEVVGGRDLHQKIVLKPYVATSVKDYPLERATDPEWRLFWQDPHHYELRWNAETNRCDWLVFSRSGPCSRFPSMPWDDVKRLMTTTLRFSRPVPVMVNGATGHPWVLTAGMRSGIDRFPFDLDTVLLLTGLHQAP